MALNFSPLRGLIVVLLFLGLPVLTPFAAGKKRQSAQEERKAKPTRKADPKQQANAARDSRKEDRKQLARKKSKEEERDKKKRGKQGDKLTAKQREEKANDKSRGKDKAAQREAKKKNDKTDERLTKREADKKNDKTKGKFASREDDKKLDKVAAKKSQAEKAAKHAKEAEIAEAKAKGNTKASKQDSKAKREEKTKELAKQEKGTSNSKLLTKADRVQETKNQDKVKELPSGNFTLRPIAKSVPRAELKFSLARASAVTTFDAPPPRDTGPDVIDVIEYDSPEAKRLDDLFRSEMKNVQFSTIPSVSRKKLDVGKMEGERIKQIQEALAKKGYYAGEISGQYDDMTISAMRRFQEEHKIDVTGYATAQSLKLLGLTDW